jgi:multiple sugar transport system substrate-binding protein
VSLIVKCPVLALNSVTKPQIESSEEFLESAAAAFAAQYEDADVDIEVRVFDLTNETEAVTGSFDTDDAMDILYEDYFNMTAYVHTGRVVPLDDMITDEIREDIEESAWSCSTIGDKTYMMPYLSRQNIMIINRNLMEKCGLGSYLPEGTKIANWSVEDWTKILNTLAVRLPEGVYPMMMYGKNNQGDTHIMSLLHAFGGDIFDEKGRFNLISSETFEALKWINSGVENGWYPPHPENLEITDMQELFENDQLVCYVFNNANIGLYESLDDYAFANFPGNVATSFVTGFEVFDNGDEEKIKVAKDFIRYIYETDEWLEISAGNIPVSKKTAEKYKDDILMLDEFSNNTENVIDFMNGSPNWQGSDNSVRSVFWKRIHDMLKGDITPAECAVCLDRDCNAALESGWENSKLHE